VICGVSGKRYIKKRSKVHQNIYYSFYVTKILIRGRKYGNNHKKIYGYRLKRYVVNVFGYENPNNNGKDYGIL